MREHLTISEVLIWKSQRNGLLLFPLISIWIDSNDRQQEYSPTLSSVKSFGAQKTNRLYLGTVSFGRPTELRSDTIKEPREAEWTASFLKSKVNYSIALYDVCSHGFLFLSLCVFVILCISL